MRAAPPGVNLRPRLTFEALSGYGGSARWFHRGRGVPRRVGEDTQSSSGASGLGGRGRAARVGDRHARSSTSSNRAGAARFVGGARARLFENDIRDPSTSHVY